MFKQKTPVIIAALALLGCTAKQSSEKTTYSILDPTVKINLTSPRMDMKVNDTVGHNASYGRKVFFTNDYLKRLAIANDYEYKVGVRSFLKDNPKIKPETYIKNDTCYLNFDKVIKETYVQQAGEFTWMCFFYVDYKPNSKQIDTVFAVLDRVYLAK